MAQVLIGRNLHICTCVHIEKFFSYFSGKSSLLDAISGWMKHFISVKMLKYPVDERDHEEN